MLGCNSCSALSVSWMDSRSTATLTGIKHSLKMDGWMNGVAQDETIFIHFAFVTSRTLKGSLFVCLGNREIFCEEPYNKKVDKRSKEPWKNAFYLRTRYSVMTVESTMCLYTRPHFSFVPSRSPDYGFFSCLKGNLQVFCVEPYTKTMVTKPKNGYNTI